MPDSERRAAKQTITVIDNRTGKRYEVEVRNNSVAAPAFAKIVVGDEPLRYANALAWLSHSPTSASMTRPL